MRKIYNLYHKGILSQWRTHIIVGVIILCLGVFTYAQELNTEELNTQATNTDEPNTAESSIEEGNTDASSTQNSEEQETPNTQEENAIATDENNEVANKFKVSKTFFDGQGGVAGLKGGVNIEISDDGKDIYIAGHVDDALAVFHYSEERNQYLFNTVIRSGREDNSLGGIWDIAATKDGKHVYITSYQDDSISLFEKINGELIYKQSFVNQEEGIVGLNGPRELIISPDGKHVYVVNEDDDSIEGFSRDTRTGALTSIFSLTNGFVGISGLKGAKGISFNNDASTVYVAAYESSALVKFIRNKANGQLRFMQAIREGVNGISGLRGASTVFVDIHNNIYVSGFEGNSVGIFIDNGELVQKGVVRHGVKGVTHLRQPYKIAGFHDGSGIIVSSYKDNAVLEFVNKEEEIVNTMTTPQEEFDKQTGKLATISNEQKDGLTLSQNSVFREGIGGVAGMKGAWGVATHPNGDVLVTGFKSNALSIFRKDATTNQLIYATSIFDGQGRVNGLNKSFDILVSHDDNHIYVSGVSDSAIAIFNKDSEGNVAFIGSVQENVQATVDVRGNEILGEEQGSLLGVWSLAESPSGSHIYATRYADNAVLVFDRDASTGMLTYNTTYHEGVDGIDGINGAYDIVVSQDGRHVYVTGFKDDAIAIFERDESTGQLLFIESMREGVDFGQQIEGAYEMMLTPDGKNLYVTKYLEDEILIFGRGEDGLLNFMSKIKGEKDIDEGLHGAFGLAMNSTGTKLYVTAHFDGSIIVFDRDENGLLTFNTSLVNNGKTVKSLKDIRNIKVSPDDKYLYVTANNSVIIFTLDEGIPSYATTIQEDVVEGILGFQATRGIDISADGKNIFVTGYGDDSMLHIIHTD